MSRSDGEIVVVAVNSRLNAEKALSRGDPLLGPLGANGRPTWSHLYRIGSPALDSGVGLSAEGIVVDHRGRERPSGDGYDTGAVERQVFPILPTLIPLLL